MNCWAFLITLKDEQFKTINDEFGRLLKLHPENQHTRKTKDEKTKKKDITQNFTWMNDLMFIDVEDNSNYVNVIECNEFKPGKDEQGNEVRIKTKASTFRKTGDTNSSMPTCREPNAFKIIYVLVQIAHTIAQLIQRGSLLKKFFPRGPGSHGNLAFLLLEGLRNLRINQQFMDAIKQVWVQTRFDAS